MLNPDIACRGDSQVIRQNVDVEGLEYFANKLGELSGGGRSQHRTSLSRIFTVYREFTGKMANFDVIWEEFIEFDADYTGIFSGL